MTTKLKTNATNIKDLPKEIIANELKYANYKKIYGVKDTKMGFIEIMLGINDGIMMRNFTNAANNKQCQIGQFPNDFELWYLGEIDEESGTLYDSGRHKIVTAVDLIQQ